MKAYLWDRIGRPVKTVEVNEPVPRSIRIETNEGRFERIFWRCQGMTTCGEIAFAGDLTNPLRISVLGQDYEEDEQSPRKVGA